MTQNLPVGFLFPAGLLAQGKTLWAKQLPRWELNRPLQGKGGPRPARPARDGLRGSGHRPPLLAGAHPAAIALHFPYINPEMFSTFWVSPWTLAHCPPGAGLTEKNSFRLSPPLGLVSGGWPEQVCTGPSVPELGHPCAPPHHNFAVIQRRDSRSLPHSLSSAGCASLKTHFSESATGCFF